ncbi:ATP-dependent nuclease [Methylobacterium fujisawaense]|uniref:ATP-dependent nuclease n=1 Tax=Methylobacterium fujisawaense TaxID=107400 RepID=UPI00313E7CA6
MKAGIARAHLVGGQSIEFDENGGIYLLTGENNSGKTKFLLENFRSLNGSNVAKGLVIERTELYKRGTVEELIARLLQKGVRNGNHWSFAGASFQSNFEGFYTNSGIVSLERVLASQLTTAERLSLSNPAPSIDFHKEPKSHPLQHLHRSVDKRQLLARYFKRAFGTEIAIDLLGSKVIPLHVGEGAEPRDGEDTIGDAYLLRLRSLPRLEEQGDGMRSFVGIILNVLFGDYDMTFLDEPEAFLHPPQARLLGNILARERPENMQLFISTHSADFIRGCLDANAESVRIARISRLQPGARIIELSQEELRESWSDPVLRFSNVIEGLFHEKVIVCEADGDCRFYAAVAEALKDAEDHPFVRDLMFVQAGGKGGVPKLIKALRALSVPVAAVVDFDVFAQSGQMRAIIEALGGNPATYITDIENIRADINKLGLRPTVLEAKSAMAAVLSSIENEAPELPRNIDKRIRDAVKLAPGWARAKSSGMGMLDRPVRVVAEILLESLALIGLFIVPSGEMENFDPTETADKNQWVNAVLERHRNDMATTPTLASARTFVSGFIRRT